MTTSVVPSSTDTEADAGTSVVFTQLDLDNIRESAHNPRKHFDQAKLEQLADTIRARGIDNPVVVRYNPDLAAYELAAGHRRCRAARLAGLRLVPALIRVLDDRAFLELLHIDNLQREDLDPMDEALGYEQLLEQGYDLSSLATKLGRSVTYVASRIRLLSLGAAAREALMRGFVPLSHAIELAKLPETQQRDLLDQCFFLDADKLTTAYGRASDTPEEDSSEIETTEDVEMSAFGDDEVGFRVLNAPHPFGINSWESPVVPTIEELKREIKRQMRRLKVVPWDLADAMLLPEAGACATCPKRSGAAPLLFADLDTGEDACLDERCFSAKEQAFHDRQDAGEAGEESDESPRTKERVVRAPEKDDWNEKRKLEEAKLRKQCEKKLRGRTAVVRAICESVTEFHFVAEDFLRVLFAALLHEVHGESLARLLTYCGIEKAAQAPGDGFGWRMDLLKAWAKHVDTTQEQLVRAIVFAALGDETGIPMYATNQKPERVSAFGELLGIDVARIAAEAEKEEKKPAKKTAAKGPAKSATKGKRKAAA